MGLTEIIEGKTVQIIKIRGQRGIRKKLMDLGLIPGVPIKLLKRQNQGPMLISVMGRSIALGRNMASQVIVC